MHFDRSGTGNAGTDPSSLREQGSHPAQSLIALDMEIGGGIHQEMSLAIILVASLIAQTATPACNNQARWATTNAGTYSTGTQSCAQFEFTITIGGVGATFRTPLSCDTGRREQDKDCFECGTASPGNHCKTRGFEAKVTVYSIGGGNPCPTFPDPLPTTAQEATAAISCKELPELHSERTWCAKDYPCSGSGEESPMVDTITLGNGLGHRSQLAGAPPDLDWMSPPSPNPILLLPRDSLANLPLPLSHAVLEAGSLGGVQVEGVLDTSFYVDGEIQTVNHHEISAFLMDGKFHVRRDDHVPDGDGRRVATRESVQFDGHSILIEYGENAPGHFYADGYYDMQTILRCKVAPYQILMQWFGGHPGVMRLQGTEYSTAAVGMDLEILETYPGIEGPGADGSVRYLLGGTSPIPRIRRIEHRTGAGALRLRRELDTYAEIKAGLLRPFSVKETLYDQDGRPEISRVLMIHSVEALDPQEARSRGWLQTNSVDWFLFQ